MFKKWLVTVVLGALLGACASDPNKPSLSDLGTRHWKGTVYLSVKETPTSIKCSIDSSYERIEDIPVTYQGQDALPMFDRSDDLRKIKALREECLSRSKAKYK